MHVGTGQLRAECVPPLNLWYRIHIFGTSQLGSRQLVKGAASTKPPELTTRYTDGNLFIMLWKRRVDARAGLQDCANVCDEKEIGYSHRQKRRVHPAHP